MFCPLRRNSTDRLPDPSPTGTLTSGRHGCLVTQAIRRTPQEISESKESKSILASFGDFGREFAPTALN
jgi:hypothetical protein